MKGMCHFCYSSGVKLQLVKVENTVENPLGSVMIPLCEKCKTESV